MADEKSGKRAEKEKPRPLVDAEIPSMLGQPIFAAWAALRDFLENAYQVEPLPWSYSAKYGTWHLSYKKGGRPLCELSPREGCFVALVVLGKKELDEAMGRMVEFGPVIQKSLVESPRFHDGCWMFILLADAETAMRDAGDIEELVKIKRKPVKAARPA